MSEEIQVIDLAPAAESAQPAPEEEAPPPPPPLERDSVIEESVLAPVPEEAPKAKRRGRPPGAKNKPKAKPLPPEEVQDIDSVIQDEPRPPARRVQMQTPYQQDTNLEMAQSLLDLMHWQAASKQNRRRQLYQSWF